ncbi:hypothetical protein Micbo1qcDRAFT_161207, partial [Microdochium bolleyi]
MYTRLLVSGRVRMCLDTHPFPNPFFSRADAEEGCLWTCQTCKDVIPGRPVSFFLLRIAARACFSAGSTPRRGLPRGAEDDADDAADDVKKSLDGAPANMWELWERWICQSSPGPALVRLTTDENGRLRCPRREGESLLMFMMRASVYGLGSCFYSSCLS